MSDPKLFETDGPTEPVNPYDFDQVYEKMINTDGLEFGFNVINSDPRPDFTFSREAVEQVRDNVAAWIGSRIVRKFRRTGLGAKKMQVHVMVSLDGDQPMYTGTVPFIEWEEPIGDSSNRHGGKR